MIVFIKFPGNKLDSSVVIRTSKNRFLIKDFVY